MGTAGTLASVGYHGNDGAEKRHTALTKAVKRYGKAATARKLRSAAKYAIRTAPTRSKTYRKDASWVTSD